ncbi:DUF3263 domain-containing protein [Micromonospora cathayae]|uniref:DUF3263 domain-containing protein n=2 Tax=Micromonospora cathayae TaxID=3028804 RepID=A0ABY7ZTA1_9ACTN|nr:DUF3263 domain-containing protein [Micromonospora sp. HUAS 3]WDZ85616.1 DUF3263 domain-containing protein [Micromonospora sp. HUAS 3]
MQPSADAFPGRTERDQPESTAVGVPPPRSAPEVESTTTGSPPAPPTGPPPAPPAGTEPTPPGEADPTLAGGTGADDGGDHSGLTEREIQILAFERHWWRHAGAKEQAIRDTFGLSATRYYQLLNALLDNPAALAADPLLVGRLRRLRSSRARNRRR